MDDFKEFEKQRNESIKIIGDDKELFKLGFDFVKKSGEHRYSYNFDWLGMPIIQYPQDIIAIQEIIWNVKPDLIIETGVARGGSLVFYSSLLEILGNKGKVVGVEIDLRAHNRARIQAHPMAKNIEFVDGSSIDQQTVAQVKAKIKPGAKVMVVLDSNHTHEHVMKELELYSPLVSKDSYLVVMDTSVDLMPDDYYPDRPWGKGDNPRTAVKEFIAHNKNFLIDETIHKKLVFTVAYDGFLKRVN